MAYSINYPGVTPKRTIKFWGKRKIAYMISFLLLGSTLLPATRDVWMNLFIPCDNTVIQTTIQDLLCQMRQGDRLDEVFAVLYEATNGTHA